MSKGVITALFLGSVPSGAPRILIFAYETRMDDTCLHNALYHPRIVREELPFRSVQLMFAQAAREAGRQKVEANRSAWQLHERQTRVARIGSRAMDPGERKEANLRMHVRLSCCLRG